MRIAVLADVHGNLEALEAVWADLTAQGAGDVLCLGDLVGYGPDPEAVVALLQTRGVRCCRGNHDQAVVCPSSAIHFHPLVRSCLPQMASLLSKSSWEVLAALPRSLICHGAYGTHGFPPDDVFTYLHDVPKSHLAAWLAQCRRTFVGHTHALALVEASPSGEVYARPLVPGEIVSLHGPAIVNVGSVGQPRDGSWEAKYVLWDVQEDTVEVRGVVYAVETTVAKIRALGLPESFARRLLP